MIWKQNSPVKFFIKVKWLP